MKTIEMSPELREAAFELVKEHGPAAVIAAVSLAVGAAAEVEYQAVGDNDSSEAIAANWSHAADLMKYLADATL